MRTANEKQAEPTPFELLLDQKKIAERIIQMGSAITRDYSGKRPLVIGVLKGCVVFLSDLMRQITLPLEVEFISGAQYRHSRVGNEELVSTAGKPIRARHRDILVVEGIVDTGHTASELLKRIRLLEPASVEIVTLLDKPGSHRTKVEVKYRGFSIGNDFVVGFGLDNTQLYRNLPFIGRMVDR